MTLNLDTLRTTVENAGEAWADGEHIDIITPPVVLELITEIESQRAQLATARKARDKIAKANVGHSARADLYANALERMEQRALGAEANLEAALNVSRDRLSRLEQAEQAVQRVRELGDAWKSRGEHSMKYSETLQWPVAEAIHDGGADMVNNANLIYRALDGDGRG